MALRPYYSKCLESLGKLDRQMADLKEATDKKLTNLEESLNSLKKKRSKKEDVAAAAAKNVPKKNMQQESKS